jgi:hypothetical protein
VEALAQRLLDDERVEFGHHRGVSTCGQVCVEGQLGGAQPQFLESPDLHRRERLIRNVRERVSPPQCKRLAAAPGLEQALEAHRVDFAGGQLELVAAPVGGDARPVAIERGAQVRDVALEHLRGGRGQLLAPQAVHERVHRNGAPDFECEHREDRPLLARTELDGAVMDAGLERPEKPQMHRG